MNSFHSIASTNISSIHSEAEDTQIDAIRYKLLTTQEKKCRLHEILCLYYRRVGHKSHKLSQEAKPTYFQDEERTYIRKQE